jgi:hypothetical protein
MADPFPRILPRRELGTGKRIEPEPIAAQPTEPARTRRAKRTRRERSDHAGADESYLQFVRVQPCCACGRSAPSEAHHWGPGHKGVGTKVSDYRTVPLCLRCHQRWHTEGAVFAVPGDAGRIVTGDAAPRKISERIFLQAQVDLLVRWCEIVGGTA